MARAHHPLAPVPPNAISICDPFDPCVGNQAQFQRPQLMRQLRAQGWCSREHGNVTQGQVLHLPRARGKTETGLGGPVPRRKGTEDGQSRAASARHRPIR